MSLVFVWFFSQKWTNRDYGSAIMEGWEIAQCTHPSIFGVFFSVLWSFLFCFIKISERSSKGLFFSSLPILLHLTEFLFYQVLIAQLSCNQLHKTATTDCLLQMCSILSSSLSHGVLPGPLPCTLVVLVRVCLVQPMTKPE